MSVPVSYLLEFDARGLVGSDPGPTPVILQDASFDQPAGRWAEMQTGPAPSSGPLVATQVGGAMVPNTSIAYNDTPTPSCYLTFWFPSTVLDGTMGGGSTLPGDTMVYAGVLLPAGLSIPIEQVSGSFGWTSDGYWVAQVNLSVALTDTQAEGIGFYFSTQPGTPYVPPRQAFWSHFLGSREII